MVRLIHWMFGFTSQCAAVVRAEAREADAAALGALSVPAAQVGTPEDGPSVSVFLPSPPVLRQPPLALVLQQRQRGGQPRQLVLQLQVGDAHGHGAADRRPPQEEATGRRRAGGGHGSLALSPGLLLSQPRGCGPRRGGVRLDDGFVVLGEEVGEALQVRLAQSWRCGRETMDLTPVSELVFSSVNIFTGSSLISLRQLYGADVLGCDIQRGDKTGETDDSTIRTGGGGLLLLGSGRGRVWIHLTGAVALSFG